MGGQRLPGEAELVRTIPQLNAIDPQQPTKMPLEARMYGIFAGFLSCWLIALALGRRRASLMSPPWLMVVFVAFIAMMGFDGVNATLYDLNAYGLPIPFLYAPRLDLRLATGLLSGIGIAGITLPVINFALWQDSETRPVFSTPADLATLLIWNAIIFVLVVSGSGLVLYPLSFFGVLGVIALIGALNIIVVLSTFPREQAAARTWRQALNPIALAILFSGLELAALSLLRYAILGTTVLP